MQNKNRKNKPRKNQTKTIDISRKNLINPNRQTRRDVWSSEMQASEPCSRSRPAQWPELCYLWLAPISCSVCTNRGSSSRCRGFPDSSLDERLVPWSAVQSRSLLLPKISQLFCYTSALLPLATCFFPRALSRN